MSQGKVEERPDEFDADLHGHNRAGQHAGVTEHELRTAYDIKELHEKLSAFRGDELKQIQVLTPGTRLEQGAVYCDLNHREQGPFTAMGAMEADTDNFYVPKNGTDYELWNRLTQNPNAPS